MNSRLAYLLIAGGCVFAADPKPDPRSLEADRLTSQSRFVEAARTLRDIYDGVRESGGEDNRLANAAADLGGAYAFLDRYAEAEPLLTEALRIDQRLFGAEAAETARHEVVMAKVYIAQGKVRAGEDLLLHARPILERAYGPESPKVAALLNQLGLANDLLDRQQQAAALYRQSIAIYAKQGVRQRPLMTIVMANLTTVLVDLGQLEEAVLLAGKAVTVAEQSYPPDHPYVARALNILGSVYQSQRRNEEAKTLYERALSIWEKYPGVGLLDAATTELSLALIYGDSGYYPRAEALMKKALATRESILGPNSADSASALNNLGVLYGAQHRLTEARKALERGLAIAESTIGPTHSRTAALIANLGWVYFHEGKLNKDRYVDSEAMYRRLLGLQERRFGPDRIEVANAAASLAEVCLAERNYREARQLEERALAIRRAILGPEHPETVRALKQYTLALRKSKE